MPTKTKHKTPSYRLHRPTGQALVELSGRRVYLGKHGTPESLQRYAREVAAWEANGRAPVVPKSDLTIKELCERFLTHAQDYYVKGGEQTTEVGLYKTVVEMMLALYRDIPACKFGVTELRTIRDRMIRKGWTRKSINRSVGRVRAIIRWGVGRGMMESDVNALGCVEPLRRGRHRDVKESQRVRPAPPAAIDTVLRFLHPTAQAMVRLQLLTGMRSGEMVIMRGRDLDMSGETWAYTPSTHKTEHHDIPRVIYLGKRSQEIVRPFLKANLSEFLFKPEQSDNPDRPEGDRYTTTSYRRVVARACSRAWPTPKGFSREERNQWRRDHDWHPHQLRHNHATLVRKLAGLEASRAVLGHRTTSMTELYAEQDCEKARAIASMVG